MASPWDAILQGRNPLGSAGFNLEQAIANYQSGQSGPTPWDSRLNQFGSLDFSQSGSEGGSGIGMFMPNADSGLDAHGRGVGGLMQIGHFQDASRILDPSQITYHPVLGLVTPYDNVQRATNWGPWMIAAGAGLGAAAGGAGLLGAGGEMGSVMAAAPGQGFGTTLGMGAGYGAGGMVGAGAAASSGGASGAIDPSLLGDITYTSPATGTPSLTPAPAINGSSGLLGSSPIDPGLLGNMTYTSPAGATPSLASAPSISAANGGFLSNVMNGNFSGAAGNAVDWAMSNPLQAYGAVQTVGGLLGGGSDGGSNQGAYNPRNLLEDGNKGGQGPGGAPTQGNQGFYVNPHTLAQLRAYGGM